IIGTLAYGHSSPAVAYQGRPRYDAFTFTGKSADAVEVWVRSINGDPVAWLTDSKFKIVASNDDANGWTTDSHIRAKLPANGTYYIIFREYSGAAATFRVTLVGPAQCVALTACGAACGTIADGCGGTL